MNACPEIRSASPPSAYFAKSSLHIRAIIELLARRLTGKYIRPEAEHLTKRVEEIENGDCRAMIEAIMAKPLEEIKEMYNTREIEK